MANIYLTEQGSAVKKLGRKLIVEKEDEPVGQIETHRIEQIIACGSIQFSSQAIQLLLNSGIGLSLLSQGGKMYGQLTPALSKNIDLRIAQFRFYEDETLCLKLSKGLVKAKLSNSIEVLRHLSRNNPTFNPKTGCGDIERYSKRINDCKSLSTLHGVEGSSAKTYFNAYAGAFKDGSLFNGRSKRPPKDPANALLSFGYVVLSSLIQSHLNASGIDPYLGFYHRKSYGKPTLAFDILEVLRAPIVDRLVVRLFNLGIFKGDNFHRNPDGGYQLGSQNLKTFFKHWDQHLREMRIITILQSQIDTLKAAIMKKSDNANFYLFKAK